MGANESQDQLSRVNLYGPENTVNLVKKKVSDGFR